ncbi:RnfABCDGE type electron transport complex subunit G [Pseudomonas cavernicola]|uniref:Ion-translocating oxidoreductase complex subunit G n=1 Tax=Pseudomonas cavernicola TaxID=2320866 RepID=A0A418XNV0_9PSED|nr:RnfABCDGE type electron transport complex subunit G [Pseudomonas cavernicola]RJG14116.1 RnfABCDGE type electron transport complex subunit G [Pseudomonas cavernicola]
MNSRHAVALALLAILGLVLVVGIQHLLSERIERERQASAERAMLDLLPVGSYDNHPLAQRIALPASDLLGKPTPEFAYLATRQGAPSAVLLPATANGYEGPIRLLLAIGPDARLLGVKVLEQHETPGLGDLTAADKRPWLRGFVDKSLRTSPEPDWRVRADGGQFDQVAGATVTSRGVVKAVQQALSFFDAHRQRLLETPAEKAP